MSSGSNESLPSTYAPCQRLEKELSRSAPLLPRHAILECVVRHSWPCDAQMSHVYMHINLQ